MSGITRFACDPGEGRSSTEFEKSIAHFVRNVCLCAHLLTQASMVRRCTNKKSGHFQVRIFRILCGGRGIRTPGTLRYNGFQDRRIRPLCHPSGRENIIFFRYDSYYSSKKEFLICFLSFLNPFFINNR